MKDHLFNQVETNKAIDRELENETVPEIEVLSSFLEDYFQIHLTNDLEKKIANGERVDLSFVTKLASSFNKNPKKLENEIMNLDLEKNLIGFWPDMLLIDQNTQVRKGNYRNGLFIVTTRYSLWFTNPEDLDKRTNSDTFWHIFREVDSKLPYIPFYTELRLLLSVIGLISKQVKKAREKDDDNALLDQEILDYFKECPDMVAIPHADIIEIQYPKGKKLWRKKNNLIIRTKEEDFVFCPYNYGRDTRSSDERYNFHSPLSESLTLLTLLNGTLLYQYEEGSIRKVE